MLTKENLNERCHSVVDDWFVCSLSWIMPKVISDMLRGSAGSCSAVRTQVRESIPRDLRTCLPLRFFFFDFDSNTAEQPTCLTKQN